MAAADQDELERVGRLLQATDEPEDVRRAAFEELIALARSADPAVKAQVGGLLPAPFTAFPDLQERAVDVVYDLCEDEDGEVRRSGYACFALLSASSPAWIQRNTDVLSQLLAVDAEAERAQIRGLIGEHVRLAPAKALSVVFDVLEDAEAGSGVQDELFKCFREGQLISTGAEWKAAFRKDGERLLSSTKVTLSDERAMLILETLAKLPDDSPSTTTALADRALAYPPPPLEAYATSSEPFTSLASSLPHDPRPLAQVFVRQLEKQPSTLVQPRWAEKALVAALGEWASLANKIVPDSPAHIDARRWKEFQRTVVSNLTLKTLSLLRTQPLSVAMLEYLFWTLYHLHHIPHVDRRTIATGSAFQRTVVSLPLPSPAPVSSPLARPTANLTALLRFFRDRPAQPDASGSTEAGPGPIFAPPSSSASSLMAGIGPLAHLGPSWVVPRSRLPPPNGRSSTSDARPPQQQQQQQRSWVAAAPRTSAGHMMDRPGPTTTMSDRRPPAGPRRAERDPRLAAESRGVHSAQRAESSTAPPTGPSRRAVVTSLRPNNGASSSSSLLSRISPSSSGTSTPQPRAVATADGRSVPTGPRGSGRTIQQQQQQGQQQDLIEGFSIAGRASGAQQASMTGSAGESSSVSVQPITMGISIKGRGARQASLLPTADAPSGSTNGDAPSQSLSVDRQPAQPPARGLLERLGGTSCGGDSYSDEDGGGGGGGTGSRRKRKSENERWGGQARGGNGSSSESSKQARF